MATYRYIGRGAFFQGLPARDLDDAELDADGRALLALGLDMGFYVLAGQPTKTQAVFDALLAPGGDLSKPGAGAADDLKKGAA